MKKILLSVIISALILSACRVGPKEQPELPLVSGDAAAAEAPAAMPPETTAEPEATLPPETDPPETTPVPDEPETTAEPDETEEPDGPEEDEIEISEDYNGTMYATISLNVRSGPDTDYDAIGFLNEGEAAEVVGYAEEYGWYLIRFNGDVGYVSGKYMTEIPPAEETGGEESDGENGEESGGGEGGGESLSDLDKICEDYAKANGLTREEVFVREDYGEYSGNRAVIMWRKDQSGEPLPYTDDLKEFEVAGRKFTLASGNFELELHLPDGSFVTLQKAYGDGLISEEDLDRLHSHFGGDDEGYVPGAVDQSMIEQICQDYARAHNLTRSQVYIIKCCGDYSGKQAVVMWRCDQSGEALPYTDDEKEIDVAGRKFTLASGDFELELHLKDGSFVTLKKAYRDGLISEEELDALHSYFGR